MGFQPSGAKEEISSSAFSDQVPPAYRRHSIFLPTLGVPDDTHLAPVLPKGCTQSYRGTLPGVAESVDALV